MAVGASQPTVVATKDGRIGVKNQMQVKVMSQFSFTHFLQNLVVSVDSLASSSHTSEMCNHAGKYNC